MSTPGSDGTSPRADGNYPSGFPPPPPPSMPPPRFPSAVPYEAQPAKSGVATPVVVILTVLVVAVIALGGVVGWFLLSGSATEDTTAAVPPAQQSAAVPPAASPAPAQAAPATPVLPAGSQTCQQVGGSANGYTVSAIGTPVTSCPFAEEVRMAYARSGDRGGSRMITAVSPVTNRSYSMNCVGSAQVVTCAGGENAVVYVY